MTQTSSILFVVIWRMMAWISDLSFSRACQPRCKGIEKQRHVDAPRDRVQLRQSHRLRELRRPVTQSSPGGVGCAESTEAGACLSMMQYSEHHSPCGTCSHVRRAWLSSRGTAWAQRDLRAPKLPVDSHSPRSCLPFWQTIPFLRGKRQAATCAAPHDGGDGDGGC